MIGDVLQEHRRHLLGLDLADDLGDVAGRSLAVGAHALGRDEIHAVGGAEIAEGVVGGDDLAARWRQLGDAVADQLFDVVDLGQIAPGIGCIEFFAGRVGGDQAVADVLHVDAAVGETLPGMGIGDLMRRAVLFLLHLAGFYPGGRRHYLALEAG